MARTNRKTKPVGGPYLAAAVFCDSVLKGEDGAMSAIRIVDHVTITIPADAPPDMPSDEKRVLAQIDGLISFKKGYTRGEHRLKLVMHSPSGKSQVTQDRQIEFKDDIHGGYNLHVKSAIGVNKGGLFWMDVRIDGRLMTRMPLLITVKRAEAVPSDEAPPKKGAAKPRRAK